MVSFKVNVQRGEVGAAPLKVSKLCQMLCYSDKSGWS